MVFETTMQDHSECVHKMTRGGTHFEKVVDKVCYNVLGITT
jgi:hypothetical protein